MVKVEHSSRGHSTWSASASDRLWGCPGVLALEAMGEAVPDKEGFAAAWGTACHQVAEKCLSGGGDALQFLDTEEKTKAHTIPVDEELCETAQAFIDYVRLRLDSRPNRELLVEQHFSLESLEPPFDAGGTGDAVILDRENGEIEVVDLKGGRGIVVEALANKQLRTYGLGALIANPGPWKTVRVTIVQPRAPHRDGPVRSEAFHVADLYDWMQDLMEAMQRSKSAMDWVGTENGPAALLDHGLLVPGDHCTFCRCKVTCPALEAKALEVAQFHFKDETKTLPAPEDLGMERIVTILNHADMITGWLNSVRAYAQDQAESGVSVTDGEVDYILTAKQARRKWKGEREADVANALVMATNEPPETFYNAPKLMSPAQVDKALGTKRKGLVADLWSKESSGYNLTRSDKTNRPAEIPPAQKFFNKES